MPGFFAAGTDARQPVYSVPRCGACGLFRGCQSPKMPVSGRGRKRILIVGEAPGKNEDEQNRQFVGKAGQRLADVCDDVGLDLRRDCWLTNALICRPPKNAAPEAKQIAYCRPNLTETIKRLQPNVIIPLGHAAVKSVLFRLWRDDVGPMGRWAGWRIPNRSPNVWICPTWHPSYVMREEDPALNLWFKRHLAAAAGLETKPYGETGPADPEKNVDIVTNPRDAVRRLSARMLLGWETGAAIDLETNMLKPEGDNSEIVSCSVCIDGAYTIAYPWTRRTADATREFVETGIPLIAGTLKFEDRWLRREFGRDLKLNWLFDVVNGAHVADCRGAITAVKFQGFVRFGYVAYDDQIKPYLVAPGDAKPNRIREFDLRKLLRYNARDALYEYHIFDSQTKEIGLCPPNAIPMIPRTIR